MAVVGNRSSRVSTSSYSVEMQAFFYGCEIAGMLKGILAELLFGNMGVDIPTYIRNDSSDAVYQVDFLNSVANENG